MNKMIEVLPWTEFLDVHLHKDTGIFVSEFAREYGISCEIVFCDNPITGTTVSEYDGVKLVKLENKYAYKKPPRFRQIFNFFRFLSIFMNYLRSQKGCFSHIMLFHITPYSLFLSKFIKKEFAGVKVYLKADSRGLKGASNLIFYQILKYVDLISFESQSEVESLISRYKKKLVKKIAYVPNGFYADESMPFNIERKENIILSVATFGSLPKNTELLLDILSSVDLKDFKVVLVGPVEPEFDTYVKSFFEKNKNLKNKIQFIGNISERKKLYELYQKSKIFIFTSRWESFGLVLLEAAWFGNFIISTDVGTAKALVNKIKTGFVSDENPNDDNVRDKLFNSLVGELQKTINKAIANKPLVDSKLIQVIRDEYSLPGIVQKECFKEFFSRT